MQLPDISTDRGAGVSARIYALAGKCPICQQPCDSRILDNVRMLRYSFRCESCDMGGFVKVKKA